MTFVFMALQAMQATDWLCHSTPFYCGEYGTA
jgi:hypothetical protein